MSESKSNVVIVYGTNVAAQRAAANIGKAGYKVLIINPASYLGEIPSDMELYRPRHICNACLRFVIQRMPHVQVVNNAKIIKVEGQAGNFKVTIKRKEPTVDMDKCIQCNLCVDSCPVTVTEKDKIGREITRKAIYQVLQPVTKAPYFVDLDNCTKCGECTKVCPTIAINLEPKEVEETLDAGVIVLAPAPKKTEYEELAKFGYGKLKNVLTNDEFEYLFYGVGVSLKYLRRLSDGEKPRKVAIISTSHFNKNESAPVTADLVSMELARLIKKLDSTIDVTIFFRTLNLPDKGNLRYYLETKQDGVNFIFTDTLNVAAAENDDIAVKAKDYEDRFSMLVLTTGFKPNDDWKEIANVTGVELDEDGFCKTDPIKPFATTKEGIFAVGSFVSPKTPPQSLADGTAIVKYVLPYLGEPWTKTMPKPEYPPEIDVSDQDPQVGVILCSCAGQLEKSLDFDELYENVSRLSDVVSVKRTKFLCLDEGLELVKEMVQKEGVNRFVFASCAPNNVKGKLQKYLQMAGLNPSLMEIVPIKEYAAFVHSDKAKATEKAFKLIDMAVEKVKLEEPWDVPKQKYEQVAAVIGGGIAGMQTALSISNLGFPVYLIEKRNDLGGYANELTETIDGVDMKRYSIELKEKIKSDNKITVLTNAQISSIKGSAGNYTIEVVVDGKEKKELKTGVIVLATGGTERELSMPQADHILSLSKFDKALYENDKALLNKNSYVILCGASANGSTLSSTSSKITCQQALRDALKLKELNPDANITLLYSDSIEYTKYKRYYELAKSKGINLIQYDLFEKPKIEVKDNAVYVSFRDLITGINSEVSAELVAISEGIVPNVSDNQLLAKMLDISLTNEGYFETLEDPYSTISIKLRPHDLATNGIFISGLASGPRTFEETIINSDANAVNSFFIISKKEMTPATGRLVSYVIETRCNGCSLCVSVCGYEARSIDPERKVAVVNPTLCEGCGACVAACPSGAAKLRMYSEKQIISVIDKAFINEV
ncbi:MAG: FAD-dependent oxidoreductase [Candidatus Asgardarchaeia archaeon]